VSTYSSAFQHSAALTKFMSLPYCPLYNAVKDIADTKGYSVIVDRASASSIIYASPRIDISNDVLTKLGYSN
ncbi:MAG: OmpH family outer membrane protein, partial [Bacteroidaceae bacterium]